MLALAVLPTGDERRGPVGDFYQRLSPPNANSQANAISDNSGGLIPGRWPDTTWAMYPEGDPISRDSGHLLG